ncbi:hypothetical protein TPHA_0I00880 [Tetrapisispora phaffii CBS 4417]|uniref:Glutamate--cysteine ligase n=1 Tax=Tetrapisispora phaffii (strain ATCC 24235 / CBS 4417 / NBRC 1672 / NRRL Y-8282 / UCD 70-5) TaxID=1071381 RepID=G8BXG6_TETPH|nr:hypothetical protein TPHA_0I00880 [Tetrapisispora phaffii CBS 4417]CCE64594.1 hypothetical protein TPHA_0I00880 [Tetrapisispora phaffii CBS 4417]
MGLLALGTPLVWNESREYNDFIREKGVQYILNVFKNAGERDHDELYWGDEIEYMLIEFNEWSKQAKLDIVHDNLLTVLNTDTATDLNGVSDENINYYRLCLDNDVNFHPEYGRFMLEATPLNPYLNLNGNYNYVEYNMKVRRELAEDIISNYNENSKSIKYKPLTITSFPRLGTNNFINVDEKLVWNHKNNASRSLFLPDEVINRHIRFPTLTSNIRERRGEKVAMNIPMYKDMNTPDHDDTIYQRDWFPREDAEAAGASKKDHIYMDSMGFGMGCSCLQTTYQAPNINAARYLYDSLVNFAPIFLALSSAAPFFKGWLADQDVRWNVISGGTDDRTPRERDTESVLPQYNIGGLGNIAKDKYNKVQSLPKARYSHVDLFLGGNKFFKRTFNDTNVPLNEDLLKVLLENDIAPMDYDMAKHFSHLYVRDPLVIFEENINDKTDGSLQNHFENIQSTNWQTLRFKPPTLDATPDNKSVPGWRVEFRPLEVQLTDFENAAYSIFIYLLVESILKFSDSLNPYLSMSKIWQNMDTAHKRDPISSQKFHWKTTFNNALNPEGKTEELVIDEIFHNKENGIFQIYINPILIDKKIIEKDWKELKHSSKYLRLYYYLKLISDRASKKLPSVANYLRSFILSHPEYHQDSRISEIINFDLLEMCDRITHFDNSRNEMDSYFGKELTEYLLNNDVSY